MHVQVHDRLSKVSSRRDRYIQERLAQYLDRFEHCVRSAVVSVFEEGGRTAPAERHCRIAAHLGPMGMVVVDTRGTRLHGTIAGAMRQAVRSIQRRIEKRQHRRARPGIEVEV